jgi:asparagine synthase (glutamine-hydrolysing)
MCGIFGAVGCELGANGLERALDAIGHRGPDGRGSQELAGGRVVFGHVRLSIIDLSPAGAQPMSNEDGTVWLTFNGEIYNHEALHRELERKGHRFRGRSDSEVIVHLYEEKGVALLDDLIGMFAFALYDTRSDTLLVARDRIGIKPLHYYFDGARFAFASELGPLTRVPGLDLSPDVTAWYDFLTYGFVPAPKTIYARARKLPAGHWLELRGGKLRVVRYWEPRFEPDEGRADGDVLGEFEALLAQVVRDHMVSDVPVGVFLSGGVDSGLVTAVANREAREPLRAFTISFPESDNDEADAARAAAATLGSPISVGTFTTAELDASVPRLPEIFGEPFADHSALPMLGLAKHAASELKVVLSGDGGDETHLGYGRYQKATRRRALYAAADAIPGLASALRGTGLAAVPALRNAAEGELGRVVHFHGGIPRETKRAILDVAAPELADYDDYWLLREHDRPELPPFARQQFVDFATYLPEGILTKVDRTSMRYGLEARPPLLDHRMVDFAARLPERFLVRDGVGKQLLRESLARALGPRAAWAKKRAFSVPIKRYVSREGRFRLERDLDVLGAFRVDKRAIERVLRPSQDAQKHWLIAVLALFVGRATAQSL